MDRKRGGQILRENFSTYTESSKTVRNLDCFSNLYFFLKNHLTLVLNTLGNVPNAKVVIF